MKANLFEQLVGSMREAAAIERGELEPARLTRFPSVDIRAIRKRFGATQLRFSRLIGVSVATLRNWEQQRRYPQGPAQVLLVVAARFPEVVRRAISEHHGEAVSQWVANKNVLRFQRTCVIPSRHAAWAAAVREPEPATIGGTRDERSAAATA